MDQVDEQFLTLFVANQNRIYRFLLTLVPRREDSEDLFQQTCLTLWKMTATQNVELSSCQLLKL